MAKDALSIGANTFQFFTRNPRGAKAKAPDLKDVEALNTLLKSHGFGTLLAHAPYTLNACSSDAHLRELAVEMMAEDLARMELFPGNLYNFHPGSHTGQGSETGIRQIAGALDRVLRPELQTTVLLETMAGKGSEVGRTFEELRAILDAVTVEGKLGVCLDTCHIHDGGYDLVKDLDGVLAEFDRVVGLERLKAVHLNDSMNPLGSHKDRHAKIGQGAIGEEALVRVVNHPALRDLPFFLETPNELPGYGEEIALLKNARTPDNE